MQLLFHAQTYLYTHQKYQSVNRVINRAIGRAIDKVINILLMLSLFYNTYRDKK